MQVYLLLRSGNHLGIASGSASSVDPRLLMLLCPDNVGDGNLDGSQDPSCGAASKSSKNIVNNVLDSGSRFGRLPWRSYNPNTVKNAIYEGLERDFRGAYGKRLWYALSRNMTPRKKQSITQAPPLNFHRLMTMETGWLSVVGQTGQTLSNKAVAVVLAPGPPLSGQTGQLADSALPSTVSVYSYLTHVAGGAKRLSPENYFEAYEVTSVGFNALIVTVTIQANYDRDGVFIRAPSNAAFNDAVAYIDLHDLTAPNLPFLAAYKKIIGITEIQNAPRPDSLLDKTQQAVSAYFSVFGFYPTPAIVASAHTGGRLRHCAESHIGTDAQMLILPTGTTLYAPAPVSLSVDVATLTLAAPSSWLLPAPLDLSTSAAIHMTLNDIAAIASALTLARHVRVSLSTVVISVLATIAHTLLAGETVVLLSAAAAHVAAKSPLAPVGDLFGWLPEHDNTRIKYRRAGDDGDKFTLLAATRASFLSEALLTMATSKAVTVGSADKIWLAAGEIVKLEEHFSQLSPFDFFIDDGNTRVTVSAALPVPAAYDRRQFVIQVLTDITSFATVLEAPAVLYPWRGKISNDTDSRDNLHPYPPCFDSRNFHDRQFRLFLEDQPIFYAVAGDCHHGGNLDACGKSAGVTVNIAEGTTVRLPEKVALTDYSLTLNNIKIVNGVLTNPAMAVLPAIITVQGGATTATLLLDANITLARGHTLYAQQGDTLIAGKGMYFDRVPALLIYSPSPLPRVACTIGVAPVSESLFSQHTAAEDISSLCYWLDDNENADANGNYLVAFSQQTTIPIMRKGGEIVSAMRNDYMILFGGQLRQH